MPPRKSRASAQHVPPVLTFDEEGDLRLKVGEGQSTQIFVVCSRSLARASKPFKVMLFGAFTESNARRRMDPDWTTELPEDNPQALAILLKIIHGQFKGVPDTVTRDELFQITVLTDKYDMTEILHSYAYKWTTPFAQKHYREKGDEALLWIAWQLGHHDLFDSVFRSLVEECILDKNLRLCCPFGTPLESNVHIGSLDILDQIAAQRLEMLTRLLSLMQDTIEAYAAPDLNQERQFLCVHNGATRSECETWYLGSFIRSLKSKKQWPIPSPASYMQNVFKLRSDLRACCGDIRPMAHLAQSHSNCSPGPVLLKQINTIRPCSPRQLLTDAQARCLAKQGDRSGIASALDRGNQI